MLQSRIFHELNDETVNYHETWETNEHGKIITPGKFQGCPTYVPYCYAWIQEGDSDTVWDKTVRDYVERVEVDDDLRAVWGKLKLAQYIYIFEANDGFVYDWLGYLDGAIEKHVKVQRKDWEDK